MKKRVIKIFFFSRDLANKELLLRKVEFDIENSYLFYNV